MAPLQVDYPKPDNSHGTPETGVAQFQRAAYLGETLYHFIGTGSDDDLMELFDSIVQRGLLMTVGNKDGTLDRFSFEVEGNAIESYEIMQKARVCFTDIPDDKLHNHSGEYGKFGIGFSRQTIISWGGNPVFYVPNHIVPGSLAAMMSALIRSLFEAAMSVDILELYCAGGLQAFMKPDLFGTDDLAITVNGKSYRGEERRKTLFRGRDAIEQVLSFVKQMSHDDINDYSYLYEREWRIVSGVAINGRSPARELTPDEKADLCGKRSRWRQPIELHGHPLYHRDHAAMVDLFRMFNGTGDSTVAKKITHVFVPDGGIMQRVLDYIAEHPHMFDDCAPSVNVLEF
jgi:hypothetical protein